MIKVQIFRILLHKYMIKAQKKRHGSSRDAKLSMNEFIYQRIRAAAQVRPAPNVVARTKSPFCS